MQAKSRLAYLVDADRLDDRALAFVAYLAARANRRSVFAVGEQSKAQDTLSDALEGLLGDDTAWAQVALVKPTPRTLGRCTPAQRGELVGVFHANMHVAAAELAGLWAGLPERMHAEMVMVKGVDSSRWNAYAGALNTMRSAWLNAMNACDLGDALEDYLPGKAPRLMASDLVWAYRNQGKALHEDTRLFGALAHPWDVIRGDARQGRDDILRAAASLGVDAVACGWVGPRAPHDRQRPAAEPALVHGVVVTDAGLARTLRRCGAFSAKGLRHVDELPDAVIVDIVDDGVAIRPQVSAVPDDLPVPGSPNWTDEDADALADADAAAFDDGGL